MGLSGNTTATIVAGMDVVASGSAPETLTVAIGDSLISENGGSTTATVTRSGDTTAELVVDLASDDTGEATVPATVTITAGQSTSPVFTITGVDDAISDGTQTVTITASVATGGYSDGNQILDVTDDEAPPAGFFIDFGTDSSPVASGYTRVTSAEWTTSLAIGDTDRALGSDLERDFVWLQDGSYTLSGVTAGTYDVTVYIGDVDPSKPARDDNDVYLQGILVDEALDTPVGTVLARTYSGITVDGSGTLTLRLVGLSGNTTATIVAGMDVVVAGQSLKTLTADLVSPADGDSIDPVALNAQAYLESSPSDNTAESSDSDGDGVTDYKDLFPDDADFARVSDYVNFIIDYVVDDTVIFDEDWKEKKNEDEFTAELELVLELVIAAESSEDADEAVFLYLEALKMVDENLIPRTDGFQDGGSHETDWIIIKEAQDILYPDLLLLSEYLWLSAR